MATVGGERDRPPMSSVARRTIDRRRGHVCSPSRRPIRGEPSRLAPRARHRLQERRGARRLDRPRDARPGRLAPSTRRRRRRSPQPRPGYRRARTRGERGWCLIVERHARRLNLKLGTVWPGRNETTPACNASTDRCVPQPGTLERTGERDVAWSRRGCDATFDRGVSGSGPRVEREGTRDCRVDRKVLGEGQAGHGDRRDPGALGRDEDQPASHPLGAPSPAKPACSAPPTPQVFVTTESAWALSNDRQPFAGIGLPSGSRQAWTS